MKFKHLDQQGDVLFFLTDRKTLPSGAKPVKQKFPGKVTFAEGEVTGHHHSAVADGVELVEDKDGVLWCKVENEDGAVVTHQEHGPVTLDPGVYKVGRVAEVDPFEKAVREVAD